MRKFLTVLKRQLFSQKKLPQRFGKVLKIFQEFGSIKELRRQNVE